MLEYYVKSYISLVRLIRSEERRVGKESRYWRDWSSDVCSSDLEVSVSSDFGCYSDAEQTLSEAFQMLGAIQINSNLQPIAPDIGPNPYSNCAKNYARVLCEIIYKPCTVNKIGRASCRERE